MWHKKVLSSDTRRDWKTIKKVHTQPAFYPKQGQRHDWTGGRSKTWTSARTFTVELRSLGREEEWEYSRLSLEKKRRRIEKEEKRREKRKEKRERLSRFEPDERRGLRGSLCRKNLYRASSSQSTTSGRKTVPAINFLAPKNSRYQDKYWNFYLQFVSTKETKYTPCPLQLITKTIFLIK